MEDPICGFREIEHTADWEIEVWAPDLPGLLEQAARGMYALSGVCLQLGSPVTKRFSLAGLDPESLLVKFLNELLYLSEQEGLVFDMFDLSVENNMLDAAVIGRRIESQQKEIKAVTYHNLAIQVSPQGLLVNLIFDV